MTWLKTLIDTLCPCRSHLEREVEYLRAQLAQRQRRVDELQESLIESLIESKNPPLRGPRPEPPPLLQTKPVGWEAFRASRKAAASQSADEAETAAS
jgi:hypothetical protein